MRRHAHLAGRFSRSRGWRRRIAVLLLLVLALVAGGFFYLTRPKRLAALASALLTDLTDARATIDAARLGSDGTIHLRGLRLSIPTAEPGAEQIFSADEATLRHDVWSLLRGRFRPQSLVVIGPTLYLTENP